MSRTSFRFLGLSSTIRISSFATPHRDRECERRALSELALDPDLAAVQLDELPRQRAAEAGTFHLLVGCPNLPELLEHRLLILRRDADAGVGDRYRDGSIHRFRSDLDAATLWGELDRVREQVEENLADLPLVGLDLSESLINCR